MPRQIARRIYWKLVGVVARVSRSVAALNGRLLVGSPATGPSQPLVALRDSIALLASVAGRVDSRLSNISMMGDGPSDRLIRSLALSELSASPGDSSIALIGDSMAAQLADDLGDFGYAVSLLDSPMTDEYFSSPVVSRASALERFDVLAVIHRKHWDLLPPTQKAAISDAIDGSPHAHLVTCMPGDDEAMPPIWARREKVRVERRTLPPAGFADETRAVQMVEMISQIAR